MNRRITCFASVVSEIQQSDIYLTVRARLLETPRANLNGVRVTAAFVDEIVNNSQKYVGLPLCADVKNLANGDYKHLGHLYDARTGEFHSAQIGSFYKFEKEEMADGAALIGYARIMKRNKAVCHAISELFADGALKFSFEISCGSYQELEDGTIEIDADEKNFLEGAAVVSFPACENAVALDLVAECNLLADDTRRGENTMDENVMEVNASDEQEELNTEVVAEDSNEESEETAACNEEKKEKEVAETSEEESEQDSEAVNSEVVVEDVQESNIEQVAQETTVETTVQAQAEENAESDCEDDDKEEQNAEATDKVAETSGPDYMSLIAELRDTLNALRQEIKEIKESSEHIVAETITSSAAHDANPFVTDVSMEEKKYGLLDSANEGVKTYTLL